MKLLTLLQILTCAAYLVKCEEVPNGTIFHRNVRMEMSIRQVNNDTEDNNESVEYLDNEESEDETSEYEGNDLDFEYDQEEVSLTNDRIKGQGTSENFLEKQMQEALLKAMKNPVIRKQIGEVIPILRVMSPAQRMTLAVLISSQITSKNTLSEASLAQIASMFAGKNLESVQERNNVTEYLLLPISMDIAKMFKGIGNEVGRNLRQNWKSGGAADGKLRRRGIIKPVLRPLPHPLPLTEAKRRIDEPDYYVHGEDIVKAPKNRTYVNISRRQPAKEDCDFFTKSLCLEVSNYPAEAIISSLRKNADIAKAFLAEFDVKPSEESGSSKKKIQARGRQIERFERRQDDKNDVPGGGNEENNSMCPTGVKYARPKRARTTSGVWKYIVNAGDYTQTLRLEMCLKPKAPCSYVTNHLNSECTQVFNYHRLLTWDENQGLHMDVFKVPSCCSCHIQGYSQFYPPNNDYSFAEKRREPTTELPVHHPQPPPPSHPPPVHETPTFQGADIRGPIQAVANTIEVPNVIPLGNVPVQQSELQPPPIIYQQQNVRDYFKNPPEHLVPPGPPLPLENEGTYNVASESKYYNKKIPFVHKGSPQNLRHPTTTETIRTTNKATEKIEYNSNENANGISLSHNRLNSPPAVQVQQLPNVLLSQSHHQVVLPVSHLEANTVFDQGNQFHYVIPLANSPLPLSNLENKKVKLKEGVKYRDPQSPPPPSGPPIGPPLGPPMSSSVSHIPNWDYKYQNGGLRTSLRPPPQLPRGQFYNREYADNKAVPSRLIPLYVTAPKGVIATARTTTSTTTTTTTTTPAPRKSEIITATGHKKINYNYHPIIDFFRPEASSHRQSVSSQDWTPVVGQ